MELPLFKFLRMSRRYRNESSNLNLNPQRGSARSGVVVHDLAVRFATHTVPIPRRTRSRTLTSLKTCSDVTSKLTVYSLRPGVFICLSICPFALRLVAPFAKVTERRPKIPPPTNRVGEQTLPMDQRLMCTLPVFGPPGVF